MAKQQAGNLDRRSFVKGILAAGAAVVGTAAAGGALAACSPDEPARHWDLEADVVIIGTGFAGLVTAITAADANSTVIIVEKAPEQDAGGNSRVCAQAVWTPREIDATIAYFKELAGDYHLTDMPEAVIEAYIREASENVNWLTERIGLEMVTVDSTEYPHAPSAPVAKSSCMGIPKEGLGNEIVWRKVMEAVSNSSGIDILYETPFNDLVFNGAGDCIGILAGDKAIRAHQGVVICAGGFENNMAMSANYLRYPALTWGTPYNTGDAHKVCLRYDIDFWHMNSATQGTRIGLKLPDLDPLYGNVGLSFEFAANTAFFWVDKYGQRFMDEKREYQHGYGRNAIFYNDSTKMEWPRLPMWQVFDANGIKELASYARCGWLELVAGVTVSEGLVDEIAKGVVYTSDSIAKLAEWAGFDPEVFTASFTRYNQSAEAGLDTDFGRPAAGMAPLQAPYYIAEVYPVMVNTNGGARRNEKAQILKVDGTPVGHLYSAGEFGSVWAWYYQGAGNVSECFAFGRIAGREVSSQERSAE